MMNKVIQDSQETQGGARLAVTVGLCILVTCLDGYDTQAIAFSAPAISAALDVGAARLSVVVTAGVAGMALGAIAFGPLGDRTGRRLAVVVATFVFGFFSILTAFSESIWTLSLVRFLTGLGLGGATPNILALAAEVAPVKAKPMIMFVAGLGLPIGAIVGAWLSTWLIPEFGWEAVFIVGGVGPVALIPVLLLVFPESPAFLVVRRRSRVENLEATPTLSRATYHASTIAFVCGLLAQYRALFSGRLRRTTAVVWGTYFFNWVAWYALLLWLPTLITEVGGNPSTASLATVTVNLAALVSLVPLAALLPRLPIRATVVVLHIFGLVAISGLGLSLLGHRLSLGFVFIAVCGFGVGGPQLALNYLAAQSYSTELRATGIGAAIGAGRLGSVVGGALGGVLLASYGPAGFHIGVFATLTCGLMTILFLGSNVRGKTTATP